MSPAKGLLAILILGAIYVALTSSPQRPAPAGAPGQTVQVVTQAPVRFVMDVTECGWPTRGGVQIGRTFHISMRDGSVASLPLNPLYFTVETPDRRVRRADVLPYELNLTELQLLELRPGQATDGWIFFNLAPIELARLIYDDGFGDTQTVELTNCGSAQRA